MEDYSQYEGKEIEYVNGEGQSFNCIIAGCDRDIGLTFVDRYNKKNYIYCLSVLVRDDGKLAMSHEIFDNYIEQIKTGIVYYHKANWIREYFSYETGGNPSADSCPFNQ